MKISKIVLVVLFVTISLGAYSQYRIKSINRIRYYNEQPDNFIEEFQYGADNRVSVIRKAKVGAADELVNVQYDAKKRTIQAVADQGTILYSIKQDKEGNIVEYSGSMSGDKLTEIEYETGNIVSFSITSSGNKNDLKVKYESGKIATVTGSKSSPIIFTYDNGVLKTIKRGESERFDLTWDDGKIVKIEKQRFGKLISVQEMKYDEEGKIITETLQDDKGKLLFDNKIEYEKGEGNDGVFYKFYNWNLNILMNQKTFMIAPYWL
ncbi:MAG TPA: hypothetical protein VGK39_03615 [Cyclobacteriaceae bacterium]